MNYAKAALENLDLSGQDLSGSSFSQARLTNCNFIGSNLADCDFSGARLTNCDFVGADIQRANFPLAVLTNVSFSHADLTGAMLAESQLKDVDFMGATLTDVTLWSADLSGARRLKKKCFGLPPRLSERHALQACESYRALKHHFYSAGLPDDASWASYKELTMERKHFWRTRDPRYLPSLLMDMLSGYTERPQRAIVASLALVLGFGTLYYLLGVPYSTTGTDHHVGLFDSIYFSFITFTTVGFGDFVPRPIGWMRLLICVEAFTGPFMSGLYVFTLTRRYAAS